MNKKLTLSLDERIIKAIKIYADSNKTSVSQLAERYFLDLIYTQPKKYPRKIESLIGMAKIKEPPVDYKVEKLKYLEEKYLKD